MSSSISNGGSTHIRYAHYHYPRVIELKCPKCLGKALAINADATKEIEYFMDIAHFEKRWNTKCSKCSFRRNTNWEETKELELRFKVEIRDIEFWAWNKEHLKMILKRLRNEDLKSDKWELFSAYIPGKWLSKLTGKRELRKIKNLLQE